MLKYVLRPIIALLELISTLTGDKAYQDLPMSPWEEDERNNFRSIT